MFQKNKKNPEETAPETKQDASQQGEEEKEQGLFRMTKKSRLTLYGIAGIYLIYLAYTIFKDQMEEGGAPVLVLAAAVVFALIGVYLVWQLLKFYLIKSEDDSSDTPVQEQAAADAQQDISSAGMQTQSVQESPVLTCKALILAAGKGTRMHSDLPKVLHEIDGKPMALYVKEAAFEAGAQVVCYVIGYQKDRVRIALADRGVTFAVQEEQLGTGHAVRCAKNFIGTQGDVFVLCGDTPLITGDTLSRLLAHHREWDNAVTALTALLDDPYGYGRIIRDENGEFVRSVEEKDATEEERLIKESNVGMYVFRAADLSEAVDLLDNNNAQGEYYLPDTLMILKGLGRKVDAYCIENTPEILGVNTPEQLSAAADVIAHRQEEETE